jgi:aminopeptidase N
MLLTLLLALQDPLAVRPDTIRPVHDALHYDVTLVLGDTSTHILGQVQTTWRLGSSEPIEIELDTALRVVRVLADGKENTRLSRTTYAREADGIYLPHDKAAGDSLISMVRYHGPVKDGLIIGTNQYGKRVIFADNWPDRAHKWLPSQDHPSDKATVDFHVEVPPGMKVIANGVLVGIDSLPRGRSVWNFSMKQPIPVYGMVVGAGPLATATLPDGGCKIRCVPLAVVTYLEDSAWAVTGPFHRVGDMIDYFSETVGPFPYDRLSHVESTTIFGGMENPTAIFYPDKAYSEKELKEETVAHETAHQWFGDAVTESDWHHLWLSEGFATYFAALWLGHADGDSAFRASMRKGAEAVFADTATLERPIIDPAATDLMGLLNTNNYPKGAWVLHSLRGLIGDSAFFKGLREYYKTYRDSTALSSQFAAVMEKAAGTSLTWYFTQALTQPGYPVLDVQWKHHGKALDLVITQKQKDSWGLYSLPNLEIAVDGKIYPVKVEGRETRSTLPSVKSKPKQVVVDPNGWWLLKSEVREGK